MRFLGLVALVVLAAGIKAQETHSTLLDHVTVREGKRVLGQGSRVEPDARIQIDVNEVALLAALAQGAGARLEPVEKERLQRLPQVFPLLLDLERQRLEFLRTAQLDPRTTFEGSASFQAWTASSMAALGAVDRAAPLGANMDGFSRSLRALTNAALLGESPDFEAVVRAAEAEVDRLRSGLEAQLEREGTISFQIRARLSGGGGAGRPVHLVGYDSHSIGDPEYVPRFQTLLDERAQAELAAAEALGELVEAARDGTLKKELEAAREALRAQLETLRKTLKSQVLAQAIEDAIVAVRARTEPGAMALLESLMRLRRTLEHWDSLEVPGPASARATLAALAGELTRFLDEATASLATLRGDLEVITQALRDVLGQAGDSAAGTFQSTLDVLRTDPAVEAVLRRWQELRASFRRSQRLSESTLALTETARLLTGDEGLDTSLDLVTAGPRSAGDALTLVFEASRVRPGEDKPQELASERLTLRLDFEGFHSVVRGALLFADARDQITGDGDWEPVPAIGYFVHFGKEGWGALWNDVLDPGLGVTLALLDFDDASDMELGIAASVTLFDDVLWCGYGRNLQAEADYFFVGLNPLALGGLWQGAAE